MESHEPANEKSRRQEIQAYRLLEVGNAIVCMCEAEEGPVSYEGKAACEGTKFDPSYVPSQESPLLARNMSE